MSDVVGAAGSVEEQFGKECVQLLEMEVSI